LHSGVSCSGLYKNTKIIGAKSKTGDYLEEGNFGKKLKAVDEIVYSDDRIKTPIAPKKGKAKLFRKRHLGTRHWILSQASLIFLKVDTEPNPCAG
jgi:hypothetical protein